MLVRLFSAELIRVLIGKLPDLVREIEQPFPLLDVGRYRHSL
jgi:hypothetical protein